MSATIQPLPSPLNKVTRIRSLTDDLHRAVQTLSADSDLTVPALCSVLFEIGATANDPEIGRRTAQSMRLIADLLEQNLV